jgi:hypothetical protein
MRFLRLYVPAFTAVLTGVWLLAGICGDALASNVKAKPPKAGEIVTKLPKPLAGLRGELELYGKISVADKTGIVIAVTGVDKQYPGNKLTFGQPYFAAVKKVDPEIWLKDKKVRLVWKKEGFNNDKHKTAYNNNKGNFKVGQFLRVGTKWSDKDKALVVIGATWFGSPGRRGAAKAG